MEEQRDRKMCGWALGCKEAEFLSAILGVESVENGLTWQTMNIVQYSGRMAVRSVVVFF